MNENEHGAIIAGPGIATETGTAVAREEVSPEDVREFLAGGKPSVDELAGKTISLEPGQEGAVVELDKLQEAPVEEKEPEEEDEQVLTDRTYSPERVTQDAVLEWVLGASGLEKVEVTEADKAEFLRAGLHNKEVQLTFKVLNGTEIVCRSLTDYEVDVLYYCLSQDQAAFLAENNRNMDEAMYFTKLQRYGTCMQVVSVNGIATACVRLNPESGIESSAKVLMDGMNKHLGDSSVYSGMLRNALRMFSCKMKICMEAELNPDFWRPADVD